MAAGTPGQVGLTGTAGQMGTLGTPGQTQLQQDRARDKQAPLRAVQGHWGLSQGQTGIPRACGAVGPGAAFSPLRPLGMSLPCLLHTRDGLGDFLEPAACYHWGCPPCPELPMSPLHFPVGPFPLGASVLAQAGALLLWPFPLAKQGHRESRDNLRQEQRRDGVTLESLAGVPVPVPGGISIKLSWYSRWHHPCRGVEPGWWWWWRWQQ